MSIIFSLFSIVAVLVSVFFLIYRNKKFLGRCLETKGVVVDLSWRSMNIDFDESTDSWAHSFGESQNGGTKVAHLVVQFVDQRSGRKITVTSETGRSSPAHHVGEEVAVPYDPENPSNAKIKSFWEVWGTVVVITFICGGLLAFALVFANILL